MEETSGQVSLNSEQRRHCLEHARDLIASADRVLGIDNEYPNIAYHLAILALEEIGKAGMLGARAVTKKTFDSSWINKRLDNHAGKLMWAVWSPSMRSGKIDLKDFEQARQFAESTHERRMAGLYVDYTAEKVSAPRDAVRLDHTTSLLILAKARLELELADSGPTNVATNEELDWFLFTANDEIGQKRLFSSSFIKKHEEFKGDTREWVRWAHTEFEKIATEEREHLQRELARQASAPHQGKPKWIMRVRVQTPSHSLKQKVLNYWNERMEAVKLSMGGTKNQDLILEMTINDHIKAGQVFGFGLFLSKLHIAMLNIGTAGFFWYELSGQTEVYCESIKDIESPGMKLLIGRANGLAREWSEELPTGTIRQKVALEEAHLNIAMMGLAVFGPWSDEDAEPILGAYLEGLMLLSKCDIHLSVEGQARTAFLTTLRKAMIHFEDIEDKCTSLVPALHRILSSLIPEEAHRDQLLDDIDKNLSKPDIGAAVTAKRVADLYLAHTIRRLWPEFVAKAKQKSNK